MLVGKRVTERWSVTDEEVLMHQDVHDAVEDYLDDLASPGDTPESIRQEMIDLGDITVTGYARREVSAKDIGEMALDGAAVWLGGEWGPPDGDMTMWSAATKRAALALGKAMQNDFSVWSMEAVETTTVNALEWVKENAGQWIGDA